jgi:uncharacterized protein
MGEACKLGVRGLREDWSALDWEGPPDQASNSVRGFNLASPNPTPNSEFMAALRNAWGTRVGLPAREWMLEMGAVFLRTETELILKSRRVIPGRMLTHGFQFDFPEWPSAARDPIVRWRARAMPA